MVIHHLGMRKVCRYIFIALLTLSGCSSGARKEKLTEDDAFSFAFLTDIHLQPERGARVGFQWAIREVNKRNPDFVLTGGDMVMDALNQTYGRADSLYTLYEDLVEKFKMPVYNTMGNHEVYGWQRFEEGIEQHPEFGKLMYEQRLGPRYYSFDHKGWHFMVLDAMYLLEQRSYTGKIDKEQMDWIIGDLKQLGRDTPIAIGVHFPFVSSAFQIGMGSTAKIPEGLVTSNSREVLALFSDYNLKLVLQGHLHFLEDLDLMGQTRFITGGAVCGQWWQTPDDAPLQEGFLMIEVNGDDFTSKYVDYGWETGISSNP